MHPLPDTSQSRLPHTPTLPHHHNSRPTITITLPPTSPPTRGAIQRTLAPLRAPRRRRRRHWRRLFVARRPRAGATLCRLCVHAPHCRRPVASTQPRAAAHRTTDSTSVHTRRWTPALAAPTSRVELRSECARRTLAPGRRRARERGRTLLPRGVDGENELSKKRQSSAATKADVAAKVEWSWKLATSFERQADVASRGGRRKRRSVMRDVLIPQRRVQTDASIGCAEAQAHTVSSLCCTWAVGRAVSVCVVCDRRASAFVSESAVIAMRSEFRSHCHTRHGDKSACVRATCHDRSVILATRRARVVRLFDCS